MSLRRYAIVCPDLVHRGAVANVAINHARLLSAQAEVSLISNGFPPDLPTPIRAERCATHHFHWLRRFGHVPRELAFAHGALGVLKRIADEAGLDGVMCHGHVVAALCAARLKAGRGIPYALVTHGDIFDRPLGTYDRRLTALYKRVTPSAYRQADLILALSPRMQELAARWAGPATRIEVLPNGIDLEEIGRPAGQAPMLFHGRGLKLLYVGRLSVEKGAAYLIEAMTLLRDRGVAVELCLVGDGPLRSELETLAGRLALDNVRFAGRRPRHELGACYRQADLVCVPSLSDSLPTVVLEAMAAGRPVVGSRVGGIPFMVEDGCTGIIVEPGSAKALAEALSQLAESPECLHRMGEAAADRARRVFSWLAITAKLQVLLAALPTVGGASR